MKLQLQPSKPTAGEVLIMADMQCPYCGADQEVCHDDGAGYSEDERHEHTCSECGKAFVFNTYISLSYTAHQADCLNGAEHALSFRKSWPEKYSRMGCRDCDFERVASTEEIEAAKQGANHG